jgi:hypothetical protein
MTENKINATYFPHKTIPKVYGEPTFKSIYDTHALLKQNASSVPSSLAGGNHGLLALIIDNEEYNDLTDQVWIEPDHPGAPPVIAPATTAVQMKNITSTYSHNLETWTNVHYTRAALKQQILDTFDDDYLIGLQDPDLGWLNITPLAMISYLYDNFGEISNEDLVVIKSKLNDPYDPTTPIHQYFKRLEEIKVFASKGNAPIADHDLISSAYVSIKNTNAYEKAIDDWDDSDPDYKTWPQFKTDFIKAYHRYKRKTVTQSQPPNQANNLSQNNDITTHLANLAIAATADRESLANLATSNTTLTATNAELAKKLDQCLVQITTMQKQIDNLKRNRRNTPNPNANANRNNNDRNDNTNGANNNQRPPVVNPAERKHYCWSHGLTNDENHISGNCPNPKEGHCDYATYQRRFGGSNAGCN